MMRYRDDLRISHNRLYRKPDYRFNRRRNDSETTSAGGQLFSFILLMLLFNALWIGSYLYAVRRLHRQFRQIRALWIFEIFIMLIFAAAFFDMQLIIGKFTCVYIILMTLLNIFLLQHYQETGIAAARRK